MLFDSRQLSTLRLYQYTPLIVCRQTNAGLRIATKYRKPRRIHCRQAIAKQSAERGI
jgi:hypothetical protein